MSGRHEVGESSNTSVDGNKLPPHIKQTVEELEKEINVCDRQCYVLVRQAGYIEKRLDETQKVVNRLKREWAGKLSILTCDCEEQTRELTDEFEGKVRNLKVQYDHEKQRHEEILHQYMEVQRAKEDKFKLIESLKNEYN